LPNAGLTDTLKLYNPQGFGGAIPGSSSTIPGQHPIPGTLPTTAPAEDSQDTP
jgi:hypothetical protein